MTQIDVPAGITPSPLSLPPPPPFKGPKPCRKIKYFDRLDAYATRERCREKGREEETIYLCHKCVEQPTWHLTRMPSTKPDEDGELYSRGYQDGRNDSMTQIARAFLRMPEFYAAMYYLVTPEAHRDIDDNVLHQHP